MSPSVTILVPSYNHGRYIRERIESIMAQTYKNFELVVIDDQSTDDSHLVISELQKKYGFKYFHNVRNSGTPFAAWGRICALSSGDFIWICESDDVAEPAFLERAMAAFSNEPSAVLFYSNSYVINESGTVIGSTSSYFQDFWKTSRWEQDFTAEGIEELLRFQLQGQTVPNMSSAVIKKSAFAVAFTPFLQRLKLTGDWLFIGDVMRQGKVVFTPACLSRFRKHEVTSRVRVKSARSQAEFILTKYSLFQQSSRPVVEFAPLMASDVIRFLYESAGWWDVTKALFQVSWGSTIKFGALLLFSTTKNRTFIQQFKNRYTHAKNLKPHD